VPGFLFYGKRMRVNFAHVVSDEVKRKAGRFAPYDKRKPEKITAAAAAAAAKEAAKLAPPPVIAAAPVVAVAAPIALAPAPVPMPMQVPMAMQQMQQAPMQQPVYVAPQAPPAGALGAAATADAPTPPNAILFVTNLPKDCTAQTLQLLFQQYQVGVITHVASRLSTMIRCSFHSSFLRSFLRSFPCQAGRFNYIFCRSLLALASATKALTCCAFLSSLSLLY
jgi:hypothetical protein